MVSLEERRDALEAQVRVAFPKLAQKKRPPNLVIRADYIWASTNVSDRFQDLTSQQAIEVFEKETHWMTDVDYIHFCFPSKTFWYYLPAFLIALIHVPLQYPGYTLSWFWEDLYQEREHFTYPQDQVIIAVFEWLTDYLRAMSESDPAGLDSDTFETYALKWMLVADQKKVDLGRKYFPRR